jgi:hypothetical protein
MTLCCAQHDQPGQEHSFAFDAAVYQAVPIGQDKDVAICQDAVDQIPVPCRGARPTTDGLDIYRAHSKSNFFPGGDLSWSDFRRDEFYFSVSREVAILFLQRASEMLGLR